MRKLITIFIVLSLTTISNQAHVNANSVVIQEQANPVETYAILFDQFPQEIDNITYCSAIEFKQELVNLGWLEENISVFLGEENMTKNIILNQLNFLEQNVDDNDLVFIFLMAHGNTYCADVLEMEEWFHLEFAEIPTDNKIFFMESCHSGRFVSNLYGRCFAMGSVASEEYAIAYLDTNNWSLSEPPFIGGISAHFWAKTIGNLEADTYADGIVKLNELYQYSLHLIKNCYDETFENSPDLSEFIQTTVGYTTNYPRPVLVDNLPYELTLNATEFILNNEKYLWEEDVNPPLITCLNTIPYDEQNSSINVKFTITEISSHNYYCYLNGSLKNQGNKPKGGDLTWEYTYTLSLQPSNNYNVSLLVVDQWGNRAWNQVTILFTGEISNNEPEKGSVLPIILGTVGGLWIAGVAVIFIIKSRK